MALITTNRLFVDVEQNRAYSQFGSFSIAAQPFFIEGDQCPVELSLVRQTGVQGSPFEQVPFDPTSTFSLKIGTTTAVATSTTTTTTPSAPAVTVTNVVPFAGNSWQVDRVVISPDPIGGFFTLSDGTGTTKPISVTASALDIRDALLGLGGFFQTTSVSVRQVGQFAWEISLLCNFFGSSVTLTASGTGLLAFDSRLMKLDMTTAGVATLLNGAAQVEATLEFSVDTSGEVQTFLYTPCTVINDL
jgi:hypothetical protein